jgi:hypothetical protein
MSFWFLVSSLKLTVDTLQRIARLTTRNLKLETRNEGIL